MINVLFFSFALDQPGSSRKNKGV